MEYAALFRGSVKALSIVNSTFRNYKAEKALIEAAEGKRNLTDVCNDHSELFRLSLFIDSLNKASTYKKANILKDLYLAFDAEEKNEKIDDIFFEIFSILGELSDREIHLLYLLERYYSESIKDKRVDPKYSKYFQEITDEGFGQGGALSDSFYYYVSDSLGIPPEIVSGLMKRLERSGLIEPSGLDGNARYQEYRHTALYSEMKTRMIVAMENSYGGSLKLNSDVI